MRGWLLCAGVAAIASVEAQEVVPDWWLVDGYEQLAPEAFRITDLRLRDPHVFLRPVSFGPCLDFTDSDLPGVPGSSFNNQINAQINNDGNGDGFLDLSSMLIFRALRTDGVIQRLDSANAQCTVPATSTSCALPPEAPVGVSQYQSYPSGLCMGALAGTVGPNNSGSYSPPIAVSSAPCFTTAARGSGFDGGGLSVPLRAGRSAGSWVGGSTPSAINNGVLRGFLTEEAANAIVFPPEIPILGGRTLASLLRGGSGSCATGDDRDLYEGDLGWWFYFNYQAQRVPFTSP